MEINRDAPATASAEILIDAPIDRIWDVQTNIDNWPEWNPDVSRAELEGPLAPGTVFKWKAGGAGIVSELQEIDPKNRIAWTGNTFGIKAVHVWIFEEQDGKVRVFTEESFEGWMVKIFPGTFERLLESSLQGWLKALKEKCESGN